LFIQNHTHPTPLTLPPLYFGFHPRNPCKMIEMKWEYFVRSKHMSPLLRFYISTCTKTRASISTSSFAILVSSPINLVCGYISICCILDFIFF
jgi:hypothetical protein